MQSNAGTITAAQFREEAEQTPDERVDSMAFDVLPGLSGPLPIAGQQTSQLFDINMPAGEETFFLSFIALFRDNEPLGGEAPTFQIRAGRGVITSVGPNSAGVDIPDGDESVVGTVTCKRLPNDVFLLTISEIVENSGPWRIRIRNNDSESLRFLGFSSTQAENTLQPWLVVGGPGERRAGESFFRLAEGSQSIEIRNLGTAPLDLFEDPGPLGEDPSVILTEKPTRVELHGKDKLTFKCDDRAIGRILHFLRCNDMIKDHTQVDLLVTISHSHPSNPDGGSLGPDDHPI